jgi:hypothetical protein
VLDWNWFFSSLSQSAAAIVGVFGAFVITKILTHQGVFAGKRNRMQELCTGAERIRDAANVLRFEWLNKNVNEDEFKSLAKLIKENPAATAPELYDELDFSEFVPRADVIAKIEDVIEQQRQLRKAEEEKRRQMAGRIGIGAAYSTMSHFDQIAGSIQSPQYINALVKERDAIERVVGDANHHIRSIRDFLDTVQGNPESSPLISKVLLMITLLFYVGVIYPLSFMPVKGEPQLTFWPCDIVGSWFTLKGLLLWVVAGLFTYAMHLFHNMNSQMKYAPEMIAKLIQYTEIDAYAKEFRVREANRSYPKTRMASTEDSDDA